MFSGLPPSTKLTILNYKGHRFLLQDCNVKLLFSYASLSQDHLFKMILKEGGRWKVAIY